MAFKIGNETYNRIYVSNDKNNLQQNLATSLTFGDNNVTTFRDSNTFETPSIWAYDERVLSKSNSVVTFLGHNVNNLERSFGEITCGYVVRNMEFSYTTNSERDIGQIINHNERLFAFRIGTDNKINSSNRFGNYIFFNVNEWQGGYNYFTRYTAGWYNNGADTIAFNSGNINNGSYSSSKANNNKITIEFLRERGVWQIKTNFYINGTVRYSVLIDSEHQADFGPAGIIKGPKIRGEEGLYIWGNYLTQHTVLNCNINCNTDYNIPKQ